jgi:hypothetical protein
MTDVAVLYEVTNGVYQLMHTRIKNSRIKVGKSTIRLKKGKSYARRTLKRKTFWGMKLIIGDILCRLGWGYETVPLLRASFKGGEFLDWEKDEKIEITPELLQALSEEDSLQELAKVKARFDEVLMWAVMAFLLGAFVGYFIMSGGLEGMMAFFKS